MIDDVNTDDVPPTYHVLDLVNVYREDKIQKSQIEEDPLKNAPKKEGRFFKSSRIV